MNRFLKIFFSAVAAVIFAAACGKENAGGDKPGPGGEGSVYGQVTCSKQPVPGVLVSDGIDITVTDAEGMYYLNSAKRHGYVFVIIPSGYTVDRGYGNVPQFFKHTTENPSTPERLDFRLIADGDQTNHRMLVFGDMHLMNRNDDLVQFGFVLDEINRYTSDHPMEKIYGLTLGDMTWDIFWSGKGGFGIPEYLDQTNCFNALTLFSTVGNHDNDMYKTDDWECQAQWRKYYGPTYYSFNVGGIHYISLDNVYTHNSGSGADGRSYNFKLTDEELSWLRKDLSYVDKSTPVLVAMHIPLLTSSGGLMNKTSKDMKLADFMAPFEGYDVRFLSAHTHTLYSNNRTVDGYRIEEYNGGALCCDFWRSGAINPAVLISKDGMPGGYRVLTVEGKDIKYEYKAIGRENYLFRSYDRNSIQITPAKYCPNAGPNHKAEFERYTSTFSTKDSSNAVYVLCWDWREGWTIEVNEEGYGALEAKKVTNYDPLYLISTVANECNVKDKGTFTLDTAPVYNYNMFKCNAHSAESTVTIKVTDSYGNSRTETMHRPKAFSLATYASEK